MIILDMESALKIEIESISGLLNKVSPSSIKQETTAPYLIYELTKTDRTQFITGSFGLKEAGYELDVYHTTNSNLKALMKLIDAKIESFNQKNLATSGPYCQQAIIENEFATYESEIKLYKGIIEIILFYEEV